MAEPKPVILVIEDEAPLQKFLRVTLGSEGYTLIEVSTGQAGIRHAAYDRPDLIILDLGLPDIDGLEVTKQIRQWSTVPIIIVSARGKEQDKIAALDAGADDYLTKPFGVGELSARVRVALRHAAASKLDIVSHVFDIGDIHFDLTRRELRVRGKSVHLTPIEFKLLAFLVKHSGMVLTHRQLLREVWGPGSGEESHYLRVYVNQLRQKIEADPARPRYLITETGVGYRLIDATAAHSDE